MSTIIFVVFIAGSGLILAMAIFPSFREKVATTWGAFGVFMAGVVTYILSWWGGNPPEVPPM